MHSNKWDCLIGLDRYAENPDSAACAASPRSPVLAIITSLVSCRSGSAEIRVPSSVPLISGIRKSNNAISKRFPDSLACLSKSYAVWPFSATSQLQPQPANCSEWILRFTSLLSTTTTCKSCNWSFFSSCADSPIGCLSYGRQNLNVAPSPSTLSTLISPPCASTICFEIASPSPVPPYFLVVVASTWEND